MERPLTDEDRVRAVSSVEAFLRGEDADFLITAEGEEFRKKLLVSLLGKVSVVSLRNAHTLTCLSDKALYDQNLPRFNYPWIMKGFGPASIQFASALISLDNDKLITYGVTGIRVIDKAEDFINPSTQVLDEVVKRVAPRGQIKNNVLLTALFSSSIQWEGIGRRIYF